MKDPGGDGEGKRHGCANRWPLDRPPWTTACPCQHWYFFFAGARVFKTKLILSGNKYAPRNLVSFCAAKLRRSSSLQASSQIHGTKLEILDTEFIRFIRWKLNLSLSVLQSFCVTSWHQCQAAQTLRMFAHAYILKVSSHFTQTEDLLNSEHNPQILTKLYPKWDTSYLAESLLDLFLVLLQDVWFSFE